MSSPPLSRRVMSADVLLAQMLQWVSLCSDVQIRMDLGSAGVSRFVDR